MAGFEIVVRPAVNPDIRPGEARKLPPATSDPNSGFATIRGNPAKMVTLSMSRSISFTRSSGVEYQRRVDTARVYQMEDDGTVNRDNFVDIDVANRIRLNDGSGKTTMYYRPVQESGNVEVRDRNIIKTNPP